jgi:predicted nucleic acid-binding protein
MKRLKIYLDTSIISFAVDSRDLEKHRLTLQLLDEIKAGKYEVFISEVALLEIGKDTEENRAKLIKVIASINPEELSIDPEVRLLADKYIEEEIIPATYRDDALHVAVAIVNDLDVIVSWNFEHIVKLKTKREVAGINLLMGYKAIEIYSPQEVI